MHHINTTMSDYNNDALLAKQKLATVSNSFCLAKWKQVSLHLTTGQTNSCYHPPLHRIPVEPLAQDPSSLHNTDVKMQARKQMLKGERPSECSYCWNIEDTGNMSDRHYRSGEPWAIKDFDKIVGSKWNAPVNPSYVEVNFNSVCNLKCSYCSPEFSSSWMAETQEHGAWPTSTPHNDPSHFAGHKRPIPQREHNPWREAFWKWWPDLYPDLKHFRMTGGEPTMDPNTYQVFDYVLENPKPDLHINVTSNFSVDDRVFDKYLDKVKRLCEGEKIEHFMQFVSVDSFGDQAEYIRNGLEYNRMWENVNRFLTEIPGRNSVTFICTMNNLVVPSFGKLLASILGLRSVYSNTYQRVWFDTPLLYNPSWQSLQILPDEYSDELEIVHKWMYDRYDINNDSDVYDVFKDFEVAKMRRVIDWMRQPVDDVWKNQNRADFYRFFSEHDHRRGTNFTSTFPEMKEFWNECKYRAHHD